MEDFTSQSDNDILFASITQPKAFEVLVDRYQKEFLRKIVHILKSREEAEDIVQDAFVKIYMNASKFKVQEGASFKSWGYKILLNTCFTYCKKKKREKIFLYNAASEDIDLVSAPDEFEKKLDLDHIMSIVSKVPAAFARMLSLNLIEGKTYEDIAEVEGISVGAVRTRMHRAKQEFKRIQETYAK